MEEIKCSKCGKVIEGYNKNHLQYLLDQHTLARHKDKPNIN